MKKLIKWYLKKEYKIQDIDLSHKMVINLSICIISIIFAFISAIFAFAKGYIIHMELLIILGIIYILALKILILGIPYDIYNTTMKNEENEERDFIEFMRDDSRINYIVNGTLIRKLSNENKQKSLDIKDTRIVVESDFLKDDNKLMCLLAYIKVLLLTEII